MMKTILLLICFCGAVSLPAFSQADDSIILQPATSKKISRSQHIQLKAVVRVIGIKLKGAAVSFDPKSVFKAPAVLCKPGKQASMVIAKDYPTGDLADKPFSGIKIILKPTLDFITGEIIHSGKLVISHPKVVGKGELRGGVVTVSHDFQSWSKVWNGIGDQDLTLEIDNDISIKIVVEWQLIDAAGRQIKIKRQNKPAHAAPESKPNE